MGMKDPGWGRFYRQHSLAKEQLRGTPSDEGGKSKKVSLSFDLSSINLLLNHHQISDNRSL